MIKLEFRGIEPVLTIKGQNTEHLIFGFYPYRRLKWKYKCFMKKRELQKLKIVPIRCQVCGEGWAEWIIQNPAQQYKILKVCQDCVYFYDTKWTHRRLYNEAIDWRDSK